MQEGELDVYYLYLNVSTKKFQIAHNTSLKWPLKWPNSTKVLILGIMIEKDTLHIFFAFSPWVVQLCRAKALICLNVVCDQMVNIL